MVRRGYVFGDTYEEVFDAFNINSSLGEKIISYLEREGYSEKGICYVMNKQREKLYRYVGDSRMFSIVVNEVHKLAYKTGKWDNYKKRKKREVLL